MFDASLPDEATVLVVVVAAICDDAVRTSPRSADAAAYRRHPIEQREQLRDVVAVAAGERPGQRQSDRGSGDRRIEVEVEHLYGTIANVTVHSAVYEEYLHLVHTRDGWKIVNALWQWADSQEE